MVCIIYNAIGLPMYRVPRLNNYEPGTIAEFGHTSAHDPQSVQRSGSITYFGSPSEIASNGHSGRHVPHIVHSSVIT